VCAHNPKEDKVGIRRQEAHQLGDGGNGSGAGAMTDSVKDKVEETRFVQQKL
jgi:hypothetical protein